MGLIWINLKFVNAYYYKHKIINSLIHSAVRESWRLTIVNTKYAMQTLIRARLFKTNDVVSLTFR